MIRQSILRLDTFLRYLSDKIKSNTMKISAEQTEDQNNHYDIGV